MSGYLDYGVLDEGHVAGSNIHLSDYGKSQVSVKSKNSMVQIDLCAL